MPRPAKNRLVNSPPVYCDFKPCGTRGRDLGKVDLSIDEFEAIRLADLEGMDHETAAASMNISRPTFSRLIEKARRKIAEFLMEGKHLKINGGNIHFKKNIFKCNSCGEISRQCMRKEFTDCPNCKSSDVTNIASEMGHGNCCRTETKEPL
ncbi:MAG: DUF134 domain-containing protein [Rhodothermaceae bacterium]